MLTVQARRLTPQKTAGLAMLLILVGWIGWSLGRDDSPPIPDQYQVVGSSMMPTLMGNHRRFECPSCQVTFAATANTSVASPRESFPCWHCGHTIPMGDEPVRSGDVVRITHMERGLPAFHVGQLVAIDWNGRRQIKRIFALPGDTVDVDADQRLLVNGQRLEDRLAEQQIEPSPTVPVDFDVLRDVSRWRPTVDQNWQRIDRAWRAMDSQHDWLVYRHQAVYDQFREAPIYDDYPANIDVTRKLNLAERLFVSFQIESIGRESVDAVPTVQVAFWTHDGPVLAERIIAANPQPTESPSFLNSTRLVIHQREGNFAKDLPVEITAPVAIRVVGGSADLSQLRVGRDVEYRLKKTQPTSQRYPMLLAADECYLVGDNVPVSIDSRTFGPAAISGVIGIVSRESGR